MVSFKNSRLLYRATRDGFNASSFHRKCDSVSKTITIIKTDSNYVFGGFTSAYWNSIDDWVSDEKAFLFSLRRNGVSNNEKFNLKFDSWQSSYAVYASQYAGPSFGGGNDIYICDNSNIQSSSYSYFCTSYECSSACTNSRDSWSCGRSYLAGSYDGWLTTEIEVFEITNSTTTVSMNTCYYFTWSWPCADSCCISRNNYFKCCQNNSANNFSLIQTTSLAPPSLNSLNGKTPRIFSNYLNLHIFK